LALPQNYFAVLLPTDARFLVRGLLAAPLAEFLEFNFAFYLFLVFTGIIIAPFADGAAQRDEIIRVFDLCHTEP
jgi:hypothetical protein